MGGGLTGDQGDALKILQVRLARKDKRRSQLFCSIEVGFCPSHPFVVVRVAVGGFTQKRRGVGSVKRRLGNCRYW